jgi:signal recognition particle GTPase
VIHQLRTHTRRLRIPIFERSSERGSAAVARSAVCEAYRTKQDVALVDVTALSQKGLHYRKKELLHRFTAHKHDRKCKPWTVPPPPCH